MRHNKRRGYRPKKKFKGGKRKKSTRIKSYGSSRGGIRL